LFFAQLIQTDLMFANSLIPKSAHSLPNPLYLTPPDGYLASDFTISFTKVKPHSNYSAIFSANSKSWETTTAPNPKSELFAILIYSSTDLVFKIANTGPKVSSLQTILFSFLHSITVGS